MSHGRVPAKTPQHCTLEFQHCPPQCLCMRTGAIQSHPLLSDMQCQLLSARPCGASIVHMPVAWQAWQRACTLQRAERGCAMRMMRCFRPMALLTAMLALHSSTVLDPRSKGCERSSLDLTLTGDVHCCWVAEAVPRGTCPMLQMPLRNACCIQQHRPHHVACCDNSVNNFGPGLQHTTTRGQLSS
jgi:hypothetical protein